MKEYFEPKIDELETNSKIIRNLQRGIWLYEGFQTTTNTGEDEKSDVVTNSHSILARWRNHFSQPLNVNEDNYVR
jgi:hypothetical protein